MTGTAGAFQEFVECYRVCDSFFFSKYGKNLLYFTCFIFVIYLLFLKETASENIFNNMQ